MRLFLSAGDDRVEVGLLLHPLFAWGMDGDDVIVSERRGDIYGGAGDDRLVGSAGADHIGGGGGRDRLTAAAALT